MRRVAARIARVLGLLCTLVVLAEAARADVYVYADERGVVHFSDQPRHEGYRLYGMASYRRGLASRQAWDGVIDWASRTHGVPAALVKAVVHVESAFNPGAVSPRGAAGLMQLMPTTARRLGVDDPFNPWQNIEGGTRYLSRLVRHYAGNLELALAAYNAGESVVARFGGVPPYRETRRYVQRVLSLYERYGGDFR